MGCVRGSDLTLFAVLMDPSLAQVAENTMELRSRDKGGSPEIHYGELEEKDESKVDQKETKPGEAKPAFRGAATPPFPLPPRAEAPNTAALHRAEYLALPRDQKINIAVLAVGERKESMRQIAEESGIPHQTLSEYVLNCLSHAAPPNVFILFAGRHFRHPEQGLSKGRHPTLRDDQIAQLIEAQFAKDVIGRSQKTDLWAERLEQIRQTFEDDEAKAAGRFRRVLQPVSPPTALKYRNLIVPETRLAYDQNVARAQAREDLYSALAFVVAYRIARGFWTSKRLEGRDTKEQPVARDPMALFDCDTSSNMLGAAYKGKTLISLTAKAVPILRAQGMGACGTKPESAPPTKRRSVQYSALISVWSLLAFVVIWKDEDFAALLELYNVCLVIFFVFSRPHGYELTSGVGIDRRRSGNSSSAQGGGKSYSCANRRPHSFRCFPTCYDSSSSKISQATGLADADSCRSSSPEALSDGICSSSHGS